MLGDTLGLCLMLRVVGSRLECKFLRARLVSALWNATSLPRNLPFLGSRP